MEDGKKMQRMIDFLLGPYCSIILILVFGLISYKNSKRKKIVFYIYHMMTFGIVKWLNVNLLHPLFGCGCVPLTQTNKLGIPINTNHVTGLYYLFSTGILLVLANRYAKEMSTKEKALFLTSMGLVNLLFSYIFYQMLLWQ